MKNPYMHKNLCQELKEIQYFNKLHRLEAKVYIAYDRVAYYGKEDKELRITFDKNILCRTNNLHLNSEIYGTNILAENTTLMEIKANGAMPLWLSSLLSDLEIFPISFSKYGTYYQQYIQPATMKGESQNVA